MIILFGIAIAIAIVVGIAKLCYKLTGSGLLVAIILIALFVGGITGCGESKETTTAAPTKAPVTTEATKATTAETKTTEAETTEAPTTEAPATEAPKKSGVSNEVKELMDEYEDFVDDYCEFMKNYDMTDLSSLSKYMDLVQDLTDWEKKLNDLDSKDLSTEDTLYMAEVTSRASKKMLDVMD